MAYKDPADHRAKEASASYYRRNKTGYLARNRLKRERMRQFICEQKSKPCIDCKRRYPYYVMDFDHRDGSQKHDLISRLVKNLSWARLKTELEKCDLVCANCHRIRTHDRAVSA